MAIRFVCPMCWSVRENVDDALLGKTIKCQDCHAMSVAQHTPAPNASAAHKPAVSAYPVQAAPAPSLMPAQAMQVQPPPAARILYSSGDIPRSYEIVDLVFAHGNSNEGPMKGIQPVQAFQLLVNWLGQTALQIGANAVINIRLEFRPGGQGFLGSKQSFEVYGYGTAVKVIS